MMRVSAVCTFKRNDFRSLLLLTLSATAGKKLEIYWHFIF